MNTFWNRRRKNRKKEIREKKINHRLIRDRIIRDKQEKDYYYKPKRVSNFWNDNYIEYESIGDKNRNLSLDEYFNKIEPYFRNMIIGLQNSDTCWTESKVKSLPLIDSSKFSWYLERSDWKSSSTTSCASLEDIIFILSLLECIHALLHHLVKK